MIAQGYQLAREYEMRSLSWQCREYLNTDEWDRFSVFRPKGDSKWYAWNLDTMDHARKERRNQFVATLNQRQEATR